MADNAHRTSLLRTSRGFNMIELMVALVILAVLAAVAAPNMSGIVKSNRVESMIRELSGALAFARTEAASRGIPVVLCRSNDGAACVVSVSAQVTDGWIIWEDSNFNGTFEPISGEELLRVHDNLTSTRLTTYNPVTSGSPLKVTFDRFGFANERIQFEVCEKDQEVEYARALFMENSGRVAHSRLNTATNVHVDISGASDLTCP